MVCSAPDAFINKAVGRHFLREIDIRPISARYMHKREVESYEKN
jgi:uncharacterized DUF497 family protein